MISICCANEFLYLENVLVRNILLEFSNVLCGTWSTPLDQVSLSPMSTRQIAKSSKRRTQESLENLEVMHSEFCVILVLNIIRWSFQPSTSSNGVKLPARPEHRLWLCRALRWGWLAILNGWKMIGQLWISVQLPFRGYIRREVSPNNAIDLTLVRLYITNDDWWPSWC